MSDGMRPWWLIPDHTPRPTVDDLVLTWDEEEVRVRVSEDVEHPIRGELIGIVGAGGHWRRKDKVVPTSAGYRHYMGNDGNADTLHQALEDLLEDALSEYVSRGDAADRVRGL